VRTPLIPQEGETRAEPSPPRRKGRRPTPIIAMESISEREGVQKRKHRPPPMVRSTLQWLVRLIPIFLVILLGWYVITL